MALHVLQQYHRMLFLTWAYTQDFLYDCEGKDGVASLPSLLLYSHS